MLYPIGIQSFEKLRNGGYVYIDKTELIYKLVKTGACYFLSRPRRFGKSLLLSTIEAYFRGQKHLFKGLAMERLEQDWISRRVLHLDLNNGQYSTLEGLTILLDYSLGQWEKEYGIQSPSASPALRLMDIIKAAHEQSGQKVVVLVDEYDKPILDAMGDKELQDAFRAILKPFYGTLKTCDRYLQFVMLTGVTKFGKLSIFSDLNNLKDISLRNDYSSICGVSETELRGKFSKQVREMARANKCTTKDMYARLAQNYDGYHFSDAGIDIYNPFSLLSALDTNKIDNYWFATGTPSYLVKMLQSGNYDLSKIEGIIVPKSVLESVDPDSNTPISVIYQSGYLTIKGYNSTFESYTLGFPNKEVEQGFLEYLLPSYTHQRVDDTKFNLQQFVYELNTGDADGFMRRMQSFFADNNYIIEPDKERHFRNVFYIICKLLGFYVEAEYMTSEGRIDLVIKTKRYIYVMEFKYGKSSEDAIKQIADKHYALPFAVDDREIIKIGCNFNPNTRTLDPWLIQKSI